MQMKEIQQVAVNIWVVCHALYFENEVGEPAGFLHF